MDRRGVVDSLGEATGGAGVERGRGEEGVGEVGGRGGVGGGVCGPVVGVRVRRRLRACDRAKRVGVGEADAARREFLGERDGR